MQQHVYSTSLVHSGSSSSRFAQPPGRTLPSPNFTIEANYHLMNFIAKVSKDMKRRKYQLHNYNIPAHTIDVQHVFKAIEEMGVLNGECTIESKSNESVKNSVFSFVCNDKCRFPYRLAIRLYDHGKHLNDARTLLEYVEWNLKQSLKGVFDDDICEYDYEPVFDKLVNDVRLGTLGEDGKLSFDRIMALQFGGQIPSVSDIRITPISSPSKKSP